MGTVTNLEDYKSGIAGAQLDLTPAPVASSVIDRNVYRIRRGIALGAVLLASVGVYKAAEAGVGAIRSNNQEIHLMKDIEASGENAIKDYSEGKFDPSKVSGVELDTPQSAFAAAANMAENGDVLKVQDVITAQTGEYVDSGDQFVVPNSIVTDKYESAPGMVEKPQPTLPDDRNIHVR